MMLTQEQKDKIMKKVFLRIEWLEDSKMVVPIERAIRKTIEETEAELSKANDEKISWCKCGDEITEDGMCVNCVETRWYEGKWEGEKKGRLEVIEEIEKTLDFHRNGKSCMCDNGIECMDHIKKQLIKMKGEKR